MNIDQLFAYPDLEPIQKREFERTVAPFDLEPVELAHLLSTPFPFNDRTRRWLENYLELSQIYQKEGPLFDLAGPMVRWVWKQRILRNQGRLALERERALNRIGMVWNVNEAVWQKQYELYLTYQNNPQVEMTKSLNVWLYSMRKKWDLLTARQQRLLQQAGLIRQPFAKKAHERLLELEALCQAGPSSWTQ